MIGEGSSARKSSARKNCSTPKSRLLDTVRADDKNICICSKIKKVCRTCLVEQMQFLDKNDHLLELQLLDKNIEKCQLLKLKKVETSGTCTAVRLKKVEKSGTCTAVWLKSRVS